MLEDWNAWAGTQKFNQVSCPQGFGHQKNSEGWIGVVCENMLLKDKNVQNSALILFKYECKNAKYKGTSTNTNTKTSVQ